MIEPLGEYGDVLERALYNGVISGMNLEGNRFFYVNPLEVVPEDVYKRQCLYFGRGVELNGRVVFMIDANSGDEAVSYTHLIIELTYATALRVFLTIEITLTKSENSLRRGSQPEVHQIEVMGGLMYQQTAAVSLVSMPTAIVISAMLGIQQPLKVYGEYLADGIVHNQLANFRIRGIIPIVESNSQVTAGTLLRINDSLRLLLINGHGLFSDDIASQLHGADDILMMCTVNRGNNHDIRLRFFDHLVELRIVIGLSLIHI